MIARVASVPYTDGWSKAGLCVREGFDGGSKHATVVLSRDYGVQYTLRSATSGTTAIKVTVGGRYAPQWLKVIRSGTNFSTYTSRDGVAWGLLGSDNISMTGSLYVGMVVTSHTNTQLGLAGFDNVSIADGAVSDVSVPQTPVLSIGECSKASVALSWGAVVDDVGVSAYEVRRNGTLIATLPGTSSSYIDSLLAASTVYSYTVKALDASGKASEQSVAVSGTTHAASNGILSAWQDIGSVGLTGSTTYNSTASTYTLTASGANIGSTADSFHFAYQQSSGDVEVVTRVYGLTSYGSKAGVMIRESLNANALAASLIIYSNSVMFQARKTAGGTTTVSTSIPTKGGLSWLKLVRVGNAFKGYTSADGVNWQYVGGDTISMASTAYTGLAFTSFYNSSRYSASYANLDISVPVDSQSPSVPAGLNVFSLSDVSFSLAWPVASDDVAVDGYKIFQDGVQIATTPFARFTETFQEPTSSHNYSIQAVDTAGNLSLVSDPFTITLNASTLPAPWLHNDLGAIEWAGSASLSGSAFSVIGSGLDIGGTLDGFHYAYQALTGDQTIVARVASIPNAPSSSVKAGVMIRENLNAGSRNAMMLVKGGSGAYLQSRGSTNGSTTTVNGNLSAKAPYWVKLVRSGSKFLGYQSADGATWSLTGSSTVSMSGSSYIGLAVTSCAALTPATAVFDSVLISPDGDNNGLSDSWELTWFNQLGIDSNAAAPRNDGLTVLQAFQQGLNPLDYYNNVAPKVTKISGDNQNGAINTFLAQPFVISLSVSSTVSTPLVNAPVIVTVPQGGGIVAASGSAGATSVFHTDENGRVSIYYQEGANWDVNSSILVVAGKSSTTFTATGSPQVGHWTFNSQSGTTVADSSNTGNTGNLIGAVTSGTGFDGKGAIVLDGSTGYVEIPAAPSLNSGTGSLSVTAWVRLPQGAALGDETNIQPIAVLGDGSVDAVTLCLRGGHGLEAQINTAAGVVLVDGSLNAATIADGAWHQVGLVYDASGTVTVALDGNILNTQSGVQILPAASPSLWIGRDSAGHYLNGSVDEVELRRDALTASDLLTRYNLDSIGSGMADWWKFRYFGTLSVSATADVDGDGVSNLQEYLNGTDPTAYYNGAEPQITKVGDNQNGTPNNFLAKGLSIVVTSSTGTPLVNAPVTFSVQSGGGHIAASNSSSTLVTTLALHTGTDGRATVYFKEGTTWVASEILATANNSTSVFSVTAVPLVAQWNFQDGSGLTAVDNSRTGNACSLNGGATWTVGYDGQGAITLDGSSGYLSTASSPTLAVSESMGSLTFKTWIRLPKNLPLDSENQIYPIISYGDFNTNNMTLSIRGGGRGVEFVATSSTSTSVVDGAVAASAIADGAWHFIGVSYSWGKLTITLDGVLLIAKDGTRLPTVAAPRVWLGRDMAGNYFNGTIDDTEIRREAFTALDFLRMDIASLYSTTQEIPGSSYVSTSGLWMTQGTQSALNIDRRGSIDYSFSVPTNGIWGFEIAAQPIGTIIWGSATPLDVYVDGILLGRYSLYSVHGEEGIISGLTQELSAGQHTIRIVNWNASGVRNFQVNSLTILKPQGADENNNSVADWVEQTNQVANIVKPVPSGSYTSPACIEGKARFPEQVAITSGTVTTGVLSELNGQWYANVPLNADGTDTTVVTNFEGTQVSSTNNIIWSPLNIVANDSTVLAIRKGDSLRLTGYSVASTGTDNVQLTIASGTNTVFDNNTTVEAPLVYTFAQSGTFTVQAICTGTTATMTVEVKDASFGEMLYAYLPNTRVWALPGVGTDLTVEWDANLTVTENTPPTEGGRSFQIQPLKDGTLYGVARLSPGGPIVARGAIKASKTYNATTTGDCQVVSTNSDGSKLVKSSIVIDALPPGGYAVVQIMIGGATFQDGTTRKLLTAADFTNGVATFLIDWDNTYSICHRVYIYDAQGNQVGSM